MRKSQLNHADFIIIAFHFPIENRKTLYRIEIIIYAKQRRSLPKSDALFISRDSRRIILHFFKLHAFILKARGDRKSHIKISIFLTKTSNTLLRLFYHLVIKSHSFVKQHRIIIY